ncbi:cytochrome c3 family protein [Trichlorobacter lovleyi]|uniref:cytochrome c3 family protein n=1 Tax=Trichlorobacter lovleyi TaxID=313985 RepID=UPI00223EE14C|nr:cytochrome c3 family protein [Trichlorobacter lovleyi]
MKNRQTTRSMLLVLMLLLAPPVAAFECTVCHSKNPAMVKMHKELQGQGCFGCHKMGAKLMGKGQPKDRESLLKRRQTEEVCLACHGTFQKQGR